MTTDDPGPDLEALWLLDSPKLPSGSRSVPDQPTDRRSWPWRLGYRIGYALPWLLTAAVAAVIVMG